MKIADLYRQKKPVISFEVFPPKKDADIATIYMALGKIAGLAPDFISVTYGAGGAGDVNRTCEIAAAIKKGCGVEALAHLTCVRADRTRMAALLDELRDSGIENVLAMRGDLPADDAGALSADYRYACDLIADVRERGDFCIGGACYPEGHIDCESFESDIRHLKAKQDAGADFLITQLFFDNDLFWRFLEQARAAGIILPVSAGVMPILSRSQIERMIFLCGASLPSAIIRLLHKYEHSPADLRKAGIEHAVRQMQDLCAGGADGVHAYTMNHPDIAQSVIGHLRPA